MWVGATHHRTFVLEYLDMSDTRLYSSHAVDTNPFPDNLRDLVYTQSSHCQVMSRVKDQDIAGSVHRLYSHEGVQRAWAIGSRGMQEGSKVILKRVGMLVVGVFVPTSTSISGAKKTRAIVGWQ